jgi:23S rRNA pseudouridine2457 synthase
MSFYCIIYKPFNVLCQFTSTDGKATLKDYFSVPADVYAVGRLDYDSEGLLILTNDKKLNQLLLHPLQHQQKEYWVQVDNMITTTALQEFKNGVSITVDGKPYNANAISAIAMAMPPTVPERNPPVRFRKSIPTSWLSLTLTEGKNRQVRKMTAAVGFPTLRLIRYRIANCTIDGLQPGDMRVLDRNLIYRLLNIATTMPAAKSNSSVTNPSKTAFKSRYKQIPKK